VNGTNIIARGVTYTFCIPTSNVMQYPEYGSPPQIRAAGPPEQLGPRHRDGRAQVAGPGARGAGFPDPARDAELLSRSRRAASGGWVVQLTDEPLDLDRPDHLDALKRTYERFPEIGGRSTS